MKEMNCNIIEDLIPLYKEGLCSDETETLIKEHIGECENCRRLCEDFRTKKKPEQPENPDEKRVFRKVNKKMKRRKIKTIVLSLLLIVIVGVLGLLTYGQIRKPPGFISFETIGASIDAYRVTKMLTKGEIEDFVDHIEYINADTFNIDTAKYITEIKEADIQRIKEAYDKEIAGKKVKYIVTLGIYDFTWSTYDGGANRCEVVVRTRVAFKDGTGIYLEYIKKGSSNFECYIHSEEYSGEETVESYPELDKAVNYTSGKSFGSNGLYRILFTKYGSEKEKTATNRKHFLMSGWFEPEYSERLDNAWYEFYRVKKYYLDNAICSEAHYDEEKKMIYYDFTFEAHDEKGSAAMTAKVYSTAGGLIPPEKSDMHVYTDGCGKDLEEAMRNFFG